MESAFNPVTALRQDERPPTTDTLLLDADEEQENVVAQISAGNSVVVKTLPGTGGTQTIVNAIGALVGQHKRVLVVSPRRSSLDDISHRLTQVGLAGLAVTPRTLRRDVIQSIGRNEKATQPRVNDVDDALVRLRKVLLDYRAALTRKDPVLGVSVLEALGELSRLSLLPTPPSTTARLDREAIELLARDRAIAADSLIKSARLGRVPVRAQRFALVRRILRHHGRRQRRARPGQEAQPRGTAAPASSAPRPSSGRPGCAPSSPSRSSASTCASSSTCARPSTSSSRPSTTARSPS